MLDVRYPYPRAGYLKPTNYPDLRHPPGVTPSPTPPGAIYELQTSHLVKIYDIHRQWRCCRVPQLRTVPQKAVRWSCIRAVHTRVWRSKRVQWCQSLSFSGLSRAAPRPCASRRAGVMVKHNNVIPNGHFKKDWQSYVRTWFNQPARKKRRRTVRQRKAVAVFPRPTAGPLRPVVHSQTLKYNAKIRAGRGFTLEELKAAGISKKLAPTIGIAVDHRRKNRCLESLQENVNRLNTYRAKLVVFPRRSRKTKAGDASAEELSSVTQLSGPVLSIVKPRPSAEVVSITDEMKAQKGYYKLRQERMNERLVGVRKKKAEAAEKEEKK